MVDEQETAEQRDVDYMVGRNQAYRRMLGVILGELGEEERKLPAMVAERVEAVNALRALCRDFGDNDWLENLHLADIIEKHLAKHLHASAPDDDDEDGLADLAEILEVEDGGTLEDAAEAWKRRAIEAESHLRRMVEFAEQPCAEKWRTDTVLCTPTEGCQFCRARYLVAKA